MYKRQINPNAALSQVLMRVQNGVTNYYVYGAGLLYQVTETATATNMLTYHYDYRGSTVALTDANGNVTDHIEYSAYGSTTYRLGTNDTPFLFNGRYGVMTDANGLLYMRARYYNPYLCRFINPDPTGFSGGLNWFAYANGDPVSLIDPFGLGAVEGWGGATATWINRNVVNGLNSVSTSWTAINFVAYMEASIIGGMADMLRVGQGTADATYNAQSGWDVAIGVSQDIQRAAGISTLLIGGLQGAIEDVGVTAAEETGAFSRLAQPGGLTVSENAGGHLLARHVGLSEADLAARLSSQPGITAASTFATRAEAEAAVAGAFDANAANVSAWTASGANGRLVLNAPFSGGSVLQRGAAAAAPGNSVRVVLQGNGSSGYHILTGFPTP